MVTENFARHFSRSAGFVDAYREGMNLVDEVSEYLEGRGRSAARALPKELSLLYASESMRLTTRILQVAAWLMVQRSVRDGEVSIEQAMDERYSLRLLDDDGIGDDLLLHMPDKFRSLVERSRCLIRRVRAIDSHLRGDIEAVEAEHPVADAISGISKAFGG